LRCPSTISPNPSASIRWASSQQLSTNLAPRFSRRTFASSTPRLAHRPTVTTSAAPAEIPREDGQLPVTNVEQISEKLGWLQPLKRDSIAGKKAGWLQPAKADSLSLHNDLEKRPSPIAKPRNLGWLQPDSPYGNLEARNTQVNEPNTAENILAFINKPLARSKIDIGKMSHIGVNSRTGRDTSQMQDVMMKVTEPKKKAPMRLSPATGRTVEIGGTIDIGKGFRLLEQSCSRNKVRADFTRQRFHERGGLKRKRLRRERWRRKFMEGFKATVVRVKQLQRQGW
jgi:small subunit ribosomal protein MRP21